MFELSTNDIIVGGFKRTYCLLDETYSIVRKGHKRKPEQANGDYLHSDTIFLFTLYAFSRTKDCFETSKIDHDRHF